MSPIEIFIDGKSVGKTDTGPAVIKLPDPPGGKVEWSGDESGFDQIIAGADNLSEFFQFRQPGQKAEYKVAKDLSAALFKSAEDTKSEIIIRRIKKGAVVDSPSEET